MITYRSARLADKARLFEVAFAAKSYWGYPQAWLELWRDDLTTSDQQIRQDYIVVAIDNDQIIAFIHLDENTPIVQLDGLWVLPDYMGQGIGKALFNRVKNYCVYKGIDKVQLLSDPYALGFYQGLGGKVIGQKESTPAGRQLDLVEILLT